MHILELHIELLPLVHLHCCGIEQSECLGKNMTRTLRQQLRAEGEHGIATEDCHTGIPPPMHGRASAVAADSDNAVRKAFYEYGLNLGLAFQMRDDWLDTYGDPSLCVKPRFFPVQDISSDLLAEYSRIAIGTKEPVNSSTHWQIKLPHATIDDRYTHSPVYEPHFFRSRLPQPFHRLYALQVDIRCNHGAYSGSTCSFHPSGQLPPLSVFR